jgi:hypothetical protein
MCHAGNPPAPTAAERRERGNSRGRAESTMRWTCSGGLRGFKGTTTAPQRATAKNAATHAGELSEWSSTRSPG